MRRTRARARTFQKIDTQSMLLSFRRIEAVIDSARRMKQLHAALSAGLCPSASSSTASAGTPSSPLDLYNGTAASVSAASHAALAKASAQHHPQYSTAFQPPLLVNNGSGHARFSPRTLINGTVAAGNGTIAAVASSSNAASNANGKSVNAHDHTNNN